jgi:uncharacterized integral membrane protein (TIGR00697 family)
MEKLIYFNKKSDKILGILTCLYITSMLTNTAIGYRYISLWHLNEAGGIFIFPLSFIVGDIISEVYDSNYAKTLILYGVLCQVIFSLYIFLIIRMPYPSFWNNYNSYFSIMNPYLRFTIASAAAVVVGAWLNIHFLSKWSGIIQGRHFILRSLGSSFIGELFVTVFSMLIANLGKMEINQLVYMMFCCFFIKSIVSFVAVWPAALVICLLKNNKIVNHHLTISDYFHIMLKKLRDFSKPEFRLDKINSETNTASIYCRGARVVINQKIQEIICNADIIHNMRSIQSSYLGYYYGLLMKAEKSDINFLLNKKRKSKFFLRSAEGKNTILSITRDGFINYKSKNSDKIHTKSPLDIYRNESSLIYFEPSQACYIGILAGLSQKKSSSSCVSLKLILNENMRNS